MEGDGLNQYSVSAPSHAGGRRFQHGLSVDCLSDLQIDTGFAEGGMPAEWLPHLEACGYCKDRVQWIQRHRTANGELVSQLVRQAVFENARRQRYKQASSLNVRFMDWLSRLLKEVVCFLPNYRAMVGATVGGVAVVMALVSPLDLSAPPESTIRAQTESSWGSTRTKGGRVTYYVQREKVVYSGEAIDGFLSGDALQFVVSAGEPSYFLLVSIDDAGEVVSYFPMEGAESFFLNGQSRWSMPFSLVLDGSERPETFLGILSKEPLSIAHVKKRISSDQKGGVQAISDLASLGDLTIVNVKRKTSRP